MGMLASTLWIGLGGALGSLGRYWLGEFFARLLVSSFPWATLTANVSGSFLIGLIATLTGPDGRLLVAPEIRQFMIVGFCGGYTTFSSFSLQTLVLVQTGDMPRALANVVGSIVLCLLAVWLGHVAAMAIDRFYGG